MNELIQNIGPTTFLAIIGGVLTCIFGLMGSIIKQEKPHKWLHWGAFGAGIIAARPGGRATPSG